MTEEHSQLLTEFVFVDTEAFRKERFDWTNSKLAKLIEFANERHITLLITEITKNEVVAQLTEMVESAQSSISKHEVVLRQSGLGELCPTAENKPKMLANAKAEFEKFLGNIKATVVPLDADLNSIFGDYFSSRPPFSGKKKSEFPDAVVITSLINWCKKNKVTTYVVSGDPDFKECCSASDLLHYSATVADIISKATVSKNLQNALAEALTNNEALKEELGDHIRGTSIQHARGYGRLQGITISGRVDSVYDINIAAVNVLEHTGKKYLCEIQFEAMLDLEIDVDEITGGGDGPDFGWHQTNVSTNYFFTAEVSIEFDTAKPETVEIEYANVASREIEVDVGDIMELMRDRYR